MLDTAAGSVAIEAKVCEPWRSPPKRSISLQYDKPAAALSPGTYATVEAVRDGSARYHCLDAAQLLKDLLGINDALGAKRLGAPAQLVLLYWRPSDPGAYADMFDLLETELADFGRRVKDQRIAVRGVSTRDLLADWLAGDVAWLRDRARRLAARYDLPLRHCDELSHPHIC